MTNKLTDNVDKLLNFEDEMIVKDVYSEPEDVETDTESEEIEPETESEESEAELIIDECKEKEDMKKCGDNCKCGDGCQCDDCECSYSDEEPDFIDDILYDEDDDNYCHVMSELCHLEQKQVENKRTIDKLYKKIYTIEKEVDLKIKENNKKASKIINEGFQSLFNLIIILIVFEIIMLQVLLYFNFRLELPNKTIMNIIFVSSALLFLFFL